MRSTQKVSSLPESGLEYFIVTPAGDDVSVEQFSIESVDPRFRIVVEKEALKQKHPAQEIVYALDPDLPVFIVKGTNMFDLSEPAVREHAELFGDRLYKIEDAEQKRSYVLRYAACHQQFAMIKDWQLSYKHLPFGALEIADAYRYEQSGESMPCFRTRRLNMPDCHLFCKDLPEAQVWLKRLHDRIYDEVRQVGRDYELLVNVSSPQAYQENKALFLDLMRSVSKPALIHVYPPGKNYYWTVNIEYLLIDVMDRPQEIATVQIDVGNAKRFGIQFVDRDGDARYPVILHTAIDRWSFTS
ncbi:MAG: aminoacyl--tRNA ligase-related protein [Candidatus Bipolaricaulia bacterium]